MYVCVGHRYGNPEPNTVLIRLCHSWPQCTARVWTQILT